MVNSRYSGFNGPVSTVAVDLLNSRWRTCRRGAGQSGVAWGKAESMGIHTIALQGPWEVEYPYGSGNIVRHQFPCHWRDAVGSRAGTAGFVRKFHKPSNLGVSEQVWLIIPQLPGSGRISLNDQPLICFEEGSRSIRHEITPWLKALNRLQVELTFFPHQAKPEGLPERVRLEIHS